MRGRIGLMVGFAAGYVLGTKAGQERYEEIRDGFNRLMGTEPAQQLQAEVRQAAERAGALIEEKTSEGMSKVSDKVNEKVGGGGSGSNPDITLPPS
jgi:gas vesicle protein